MYHTRSKTERDGHIEGPARQHLIDTPEMGDPKKFKNTGFKTEGRSFCHKRELYYTGSIRETRHFPLYLTWSLPLEPLSTTQHININVKNPKKYHLDSQHESTMAE